MGHHIQGCPKTFAGLCKLAPSSVLSSHNVSQTTLYSCSHSSVVAGARGFGDDEEDVELEEDGDGEKHGVDDEARHAQGPRQDESEKMNWCHELYL